ncbi:malonate decarboxylase subunit alpha [Sesbania bispinosa]|nr:malonate decarboxylase subunit alpha [Sesbania bispinosa]
MATSKQLLLIYTDSRRDWDFTGRDQKRRKRQGLPLVAAQYVADEDYYPTTHDSTSLIIN